MSISRETDRIMTRPIKCDIGSTPVRTRSIQFSTEEESAASFMDQHSEMARMLASNPPLGSIDTIGRAEEMEWRADLYRELDELRHQIAMVEVMLASSSLQARTAKLQTEYADMLERIDRSLQGKPVGPVASEAA